MFFFFLHLCVLILLPRAWFYYYFTFYQIRYGVREYACTAIDMIARRLRLAFLNNQAAQEALPAVIEIMAEELKWSEKEKKVCVLLL